MDLDRYYIILIFKGMAKIFQSLSKFSNIKHNTILYNYILHFDGIFNLVLTQIFGLKYWLSIIDFMLQLKR